MDTLWLELLAVRVAAGSQRGRLAQTLLSRRSPRPLLTTGPWQPSDNAWREAERQLRVMQLLGISLVPVWELSALLTRLRPLPPMLFVRGKADLLHRPAVAVVGSREATAEGERWAILRAREAANRNLVLVSGGARGIDAAAHAGAIAVGGGTLAYLGVAADRIYPEHNRRLFERLLTRGGALVSEHPPGAVTYNFDHAKRNRLIAAHSSLLFVVQADARSGSLGTARFAQRYGVPVQLAPPEVGGKQQGLEILRLEGWAESYSEKWPERLAAPLASPPPQV